MDAMDDIIIKRFNNNRDVIDQFPVTMIYAPKQRTIWDLQNPEKTIVLPIVSVYFGGIARDTDRVFNKLEGAYFDPDGYGSNVAERLRQPMPINLTVNVSILAKYQTDIDQIITNFVPYFDPYIVIEWTVPGFKHRLNAQVFWNENINFTYPVEINATTKWQVSADTSFTIKGWIFKSQKVGVGKIYKIDAAYTNVKDIPLGYFNPRTNSGDPYITDAFILSGQPVPKLIDPSFALVNESNQSFVVYGDMFRGVTNVFLSGSNQFTSLSPFLTSSLTAVDIFSTNYVLSSLYPAFSAVPVLTYDVISNNKLIFNIPTPINTSNLDVIVVNKAGYGRLKLDSIIPTFNPFLSGNEFYSSYIQPQTESISGLRVV